MSPQIVVVSTQTVQVSVENPFLRVKVNPKVLPSALYLGVVFCEALKILVTLV